MRRAGWHDAGSPQLPPERPSVRRGCAGCRAVRAVRAARARRRSGAGPVRLEAVGCRRPTVSDFDSGCHRRSRCAGPLLHHHSDCHQDAGRRLRPGSCPELSSAGTRAAVSLLPHSPLRRREAGSGCGCGSYCDSGSRLRRHCPPNHRNLHYRRPRNCRPSARCAKRCSRRPWRGHPTAPLVPRPSSREIRK